MCEVFEHMNIKLVLGVGLPASGKTSFFKSITMDNWNVLHVEFDLIERNLLNSSSHDDKDELKYWHQARIIAEDVVESRVKQAIESPKTTLIMIDDNFYYSSMRRPYKRIARKYGCSYFEINFCATAVDCIVANVSRAHPVPSSIIETMASKIQYAKDPMLISCDVDSSIHLTEFYTLIKESRPLPVLYSGDKKGSESMLYKFDQAYRSMVKRLLNNVENVLKSNVAYVFGEIKRRYVQESYPNLFVDELEDLFEETLNEKFKLKF